MAIATLHRALEHFVVEGLLETRLGLVVTTHAEQGLRLLQQMPRGEVELMVKVHEMSQRAAGAAGAGSSFSADTR